MDTSRRKLSFEKWWPNLRRTGYTITSEADILYNCFAWAVHHTDFWFAPDTLVNRFGRVFWPEEVPKVNTLEAFIQAFATFGFTACDNTSLEREFEKVVIYANDRVPTHAARQLPNGRWTSKIGEYEDIEHDIDAFVGGKYFGTIAIILKRPIN